MAINLKRLLSQQRRIDSAQVTRAYTSFFAIVGETENHQQQARRMAIQTILRRAGGHHA